MVYVAPGRLEMVVYSPYCIGKMGVVARRRRFRGYFCRCLCTV
jgi:hypothetical protein